MRRGRRTRGAKRDLPLFPVNVHMSPNTKYRFKPYIEWFSLLNRTVRRTYVRTFELLMAIYGFLLPNIISQ